MSDNLRYPIGKFEPQDFSDELKQVWLNDIRFLPQSLELSVTNFDEMQMNSTYREGGWTVRQVVHHVADSHINAYCRFKLGLTEENPTIRPYEEHLWAELKDAELVPVNISITLLFALHARWHTLLSEMTNDEYNRTVYHPEQKRTYTLWHLLGMYAWHGKHHVAHIQSLRERMNWR